MKLLLLSDQMEKAIVDNIVESCRTPNEVEMLRKQSYQWLHLCNGFIAHYDWTGFIDYYMRRSNLTLKEDILNNREINQHSNFSSKDKDYEYMMQRKRMYNTICDRI